ncbi:MAG: hypothetical protein WD871_15330 [Xanthobacteraceae bacterium]
MPIEDNVLWWFMVSTAFSAAGISIGAAILDRRATDWPGRNARFLLHMFSYLLMTISVSIFILRGLLLSS